MIRGIVTDILARTLYFIYKKYTFQCNLMESNQLWSPTSYGVQPVMEFSQLWSSASYGVQPVIHQRGTIPIQNLCSPSWVDLWWEDHKPKIKHLGLTNVLVGIATN